MEQFPSFSILENILQNLLSFPVWCYKNVSQFLHVRKVVEYASSLNLMFNWIVYSQLSQHTRVTGASWKSQAETRSYSIREASGGSYRGSAWDIRDTATRATRGGEEAALHQACQTNRQAALHQPCQTTRQAALHQACQTNLGYYWKWDQVDLVEMSHQYFLCVLKICRCHKLA